MTDVSPNPPNWTRRKKTSGDDSIATRTKNSNTAPRNYFARREQYRLFVLCATLMLVLAMMNEARKPANWDWLWVGEQTQIETAERPEQPIDTRLETSSTSLPVDGFRAANENIENDNVASQNVGIESVTDEAMDVQIPGVTQQTLASIEDDSVLRSAETDVWYAMLKWLNESNQQEVQSRSMGEVGFAQLYQQADVYRGRIVNVRGTIHRVEEITPRENVAGITQLFRWIVEPAGPSNSPIVIYSVKKPIDFRIGDDLREEATFTGLFFKRWAYAAGDGTRVAPLLLAKTATWTRREPTTPMQLPSASTMWATLLSLAVCSAAIALIVYRTSVARRPEIDRMRKTETNSVALNDDEVLPTTSEMLDELASLHREVERDV